MTHRQIAKKLLKEIYGTLNQKIADNENDDNKKNYSNRNRKVDKML